MKRCSMPGLVRETQLKTTLMQPFTRTRMAGPKKQTTRVGETPEGTCTPLPLSVGMETAAAAWETAWKFLQSLNRVTIYPAILVPGLIPRDMKSCPPRSLYTAPIAALVTRAKKWEQPTRLSTDYWINNVCYVHKTEHLVIKRNTCYDVDEPWQLHYMNDAHHKTLRFMIPFTRDVQNRPICRDTKRLAVTLGLKGLWREERSVTANGHKRFFWGGDERF